MGNAKEILKSYSIEKFYKKELENEEIKLKNNNENSKSISKELKSVTNLIENVEDSIMSLNQPSKSILHYRYIKKLSYDYIALKLNYSTQRIYQLMKKALTEFETEYESRVQANQRAV